MHKKILHLIVAALIMIPVTDLMAAGNYAGKKILYIDSYHEGYEWSDGITQGIQDVLKETGAELQIFRMDSKRHRSEEFQKSTALHAKALIEEFQPDVVIASDDTASKYLIVPYYKDADVPFVFCGVNWDASVYGFPYKNVTGMVEVGLFTQLIHQLGHYAQGERVGFLGTDTFTQRNALKYHAPILGITYTQVYHVTSFEEWKQQFLTLQHEVDVIMLAQTSGVAGWNDEQARVFVEKYSKVPTGVTSTGMMPFALAGIVKIPEEQGRWAAQAALKILDGVPPDNIPITRNKQGKLFFNMSIGKTLGITAAPAGSNIIY